MMLERGAVVTRTPFSLSNLAALALCVAALVNLAAPSLTRAAVCGDVNGDGVVNIGDALVVAQYDVGLRTCGVAPFSHPEVCDVNGDAACDIGDALRMAQCDVGLIGCVFTCGSFACSSTTTTTTTTSTSSTTTTTTAPPACHFPATGQTTCWDSSGNVIPCAGTGQDGDLQKGAPLSYTDNGDGTITGNNTGLMWEKLSMDGSVHDVSNTYTWANAFAQHVATLNGTSFAGHTDWRMPNVKELESIMNYQNVDPTVSPAFNTNCTSGCTVLTCSCTTSSSGYWSSTTAASNPSTAGVLDTGGGGVCLDSKSVLDNVRGVRGGS